MNKTVTVKQLSTALNVTQAAITRYLRDRKLVDDLEKDGKRYLINEELAIKIVNHFTGYEGTLIFDGKSITVELPKTTVANGGTTVGNKETTVANKDEDNLSTIIELLKANIETMEEQLKVKDEQIASLSKSNEELTKNIGELVASNRALGAGNVATNLANAKREISNDGGGDEPAASGGSVIDVSSSAGDVRPPLTRWQAFTYWITGNYKSGE